MFSNVIKGSIAALGCASLVNAISSSAGRTVLVDGIYYYVPAMAVSSLGVSWDQLQVATSSGDDLIPMTVMTGDFSTFDSNSLTSAITKYATEDDVFSNGFLQGKTPLLLGTSILIGIF
jgi:hypothetical protein